ncbi:MAG: hypothetical protein R3321_10025 [Nitrososphaeraceae archaeon]|nr:hypothetical protein [Nitrososphaeraceae archaeon]
MNLTSTFLMLSLIVFLGGLFLSGFFLGSYWEENKQFKKIKKLQDENEELIKRNAWLLANTMQLHKMKDKK